MILKAPFLKELSQRKQPSREAKLLEFIILVKARAGLYSTCMIRSVQVFNEKPLREAGYFVTKTGSATWNTPRKVDTRATDRILSATFAKSLADRPFMPQELKVMEMEMLLRATDGFLSVEYRGKLNDFETVQLTLSGYTIKDTVGGTILEWAM